MTEREHLDAAAAYALGAADSAERETLDALMADDPEFRREVERLMAWTAPTAQAPSNLRDRILSDAAQVRPISARVAAGPARRLTSVLPWLAVAASLGVAIVNSNRLTDARASLGELRAALATAEQRSANKDSIISSFMGPEVHVVSLHSGEDKPSARVYWNHTRRVFVATVFNVPRAPDGRVYQLWAIVKGKAPMSMGTFNTDAGGRATMVFPVSDEVTAGGHIDLCGLTLEPAGGSPQPTETPRLVGEWRHTD